MKEKCVNQIKQRIIDAPSCMGDIDETVEQIMIATFDYMNENEAGCYYCQNRNRLSVFSMCKVNHHLQPECCDSSLDIKRFLKKNSAEIMSKVNSTLSGSGIGVKLGCDNDFKRQVISESVQLFESMDFENASQIIQH